MRTRNVIKNMLSSWCGQVCVIISSLVLRKIFTLVLPIEYLGISDLFSNILSILSFADLGLGMSISYYLYEPLAQNNKEQIAYVTQYYKKIYFKVGCAVWGVGMLIMPFLDAIIRDCSIPHIKFIYFLYIVNAAISYFNTHKVTLLNADQKKYISNTYSNIIKVLQTFVGIIVLVYTKAYIPYYILQILATVLLNIMISIKVDKTYPYLKELKNVKSVQGLEAKKNINHNMGAMLLHKIATVVVNGTDNILISSFVSLVSVGLYSNYATIITNINNTFSNLYYSMSASIGNYVTAESKENKTQLFYTLLFSEFWIFGFGAICLFNLCSPFIRLWFGEEFVLEGSIVFILCLNFYLQGMRRVVLSFRDAEGLFNQDKYKAVLEALINLIASLYFVKKIGILGVFVGTTISLVAVCAWMEPLILFRYSLSGGIRHYVITYLRYLIEVLAVGSITYFACCKLGDAIELFIIKLLICCVVPNVCFGFFHWRSREFKELYMKICNIIKKHKV